MHRHFFLPPTAKAAGKAGNIQAWLTFVTLQALPKKTNCRALYVQKYLVIWMLVAGWYVQVHAQTGSNLRLQKIPTAADTLQLDSLSIVPGTFAMPGVADSCYTLLPVEARLVWRHRPAIDSVLVQYRVLGTALGSYAYRYRYDSIADFFKAQPGRPILGGKEAAEDRFLDFGNLNYTGSFGRSLAFGNNQDAVVNSLFNLQLSGMLGDSIFVAAAITDNNIPIMPDGTTQQLNEFDRVWLQFKKRPWELNIGDIDIRQQPGYFMSYYKRQQGLAFSMDQRLGKQVQHKMLASGAIAKGKFTRNVFMGQEANQGPYRLQGANNEFFFIVLPGTERVFVDGIMQQRGEDQDYIINYNTAEITFTPRQLINKDKRIQIEFEYADRNYLNSLLYFGNEFKIGDKWEVNLAFYANTDAKNSTINITLDPQQRQLLSEVGDSIQNAFFPSAVRDTFATGKILYVRTDTLVNSILYSGIYVYSATEQPEMFSLSFSEVGQGRGNYVPLFNAANGRAFQWVAPLNGVPQGNFEPVQLLVTPKQQQMGTAVVRYKLRPGTLIAAEAALSRWDVNRFSSRDKGNDLGAGLKLHLQDERSLRGARKALALRTELGYEYVGATFRPLERIREVEFLRDWGLPFDAPAATEQLPLVQLTLADSSRQQLTYRYQGYLRSDGYRGHRHTVDHALTWKGWQLKDIWRSTLMRSTDFNGVFLRPELSLNKQLEKWKNYSTGISYSLEHNALRHAATDTLLPLSFSFRDWNAWLRSNAAKPNRWGLQWFNRANHLPLGRSFVPMDEQNTLSLHWEMLKSPKHQWRTTATYRNLQVKDTSITTQQAEQSLLGRAEYQMNLLKGALTANVLYELGGGQEQRRDFSYIEVPAGRGEFMWIDYNEDGIPQLNEFEVAPFPDLARYIRIFTPTNDFIRASYTTFNYSISFNPRLLWRSSKVKWQQFLGRWQAQSALQTNRKQQNTGLFQWNPFTGNVSDTNLIALNLSIANTLSYNRFSTRWGADLTQVRNLNRQLLTYGFETRETLDYTLRLRRNFGKKWTSEWVNRLGSNQLTTPNPKFDNRNFDIQSYTTEPRVTFTNGTVFRTVLSYKYDHRDATSVAGPQEARIHSIISETKWNAVQSSVVTARCTYSQIGFTGPTNSTVAFIMLDALQPGQNLLWNLELTRRLAKSFEVTFNYEGRSAGTTRTIHIGRAALRAVL